MKRTKRVITLALAICVTASTAALTGCEDKNGSSASDSASTVEDTTSQLDKESGLPDSDQRFTSDESTGSGYMNTIKLDDPEFTQHNHIDMSSSEAERFFMTKLNGEPYYATQVNYQNYWDPEKWSEWKGEDDEHSKELFPAGDPRIVWPMMSLGAAQFSLAWECTSKADGLVFGDPYTFDDYYNLVFNFDKEDVSDIKFVGVNNRLPNMCGWFKFTPKVTDQEGMKSGDADKILDSYTLNYDIVLPFDGGLHYYGTITPREIERPAAPEYDFAIKDSMGNIIVWSIYPGAFPLSAEDVALGDDTPHIMLNLHIEDVNGKVYDCMMTDMT